MPPAATMETGPPMPHWRAGTAFATQKFTGQTRPATRRRPRSAPRQSPPAGPDPLTKGPALLSRPPRSSRHRPVRTPPRHARAVLRLEALEDRLAPSVAHVAVIGDF